MLGLGSLEDREGAGMYEDTEQPLEREIGGLTIGGQGD